MAWETTPPSSSIESPGDRPVERRWRCERARTPGCGKAGPAVTFDPLPHASRGSLSEARDVTRLLRDWSNGDAAAFPLLVEQVYPELHRIAARHLRSERPDHTLQPTALVHEAYLRLAGREPGGRWADRGHFFAVAAHVVRAVLVDHARARQAVKRGAGAVAVEMTVETTPTAMPVDVLDLDAALNALEALDAEHVRIVELRYFAGLSIDETAAAMGTSPSSVKRGWMAAKTYIRRHLDGEIARA
jgi:RNA polymerase sigma factor (TIGR02999 family)